MDQHELHQRVLAILRDVLGVPDLEVEDSHSAREIPNYDSLAHIQILVQCQQAFGVKLTAMEAGQIANFGELKSTIARKLESS